MSPAAVTAMRGMSCFAQCKREQRIRPGVVRKRKTRNTSLEIVEIRLVTRPGLRADTMTRSRLHQDPKKLPSMVRTFNRRLLTLEVGISLFLDKRFASDPLVFRELSQFPTQTIPG